MSRVIHKYAIMKQMEGEVTINIANTTDYVKATQGFSFDEQNGFIRQNGHELRCEVEGDYLVFWKALVKSVNGANDLIFIALFVNDGVTDKVVDNTKDYVTINSANKKASISGMGRVTLNVNDVVTIGVRNSSRNVDVLIDNTSLCLIRVSS